MNKVCLVYWLVRRNSDLKSCSDFLQTLEITNIMKNIVAVDLIHFSGCGCL